MTRGLLRVGENSMSVYPLDLQREIDRRWRHRFMHLDHRTPNRIGSGLHGRSEWRITPRQKRKITHRGRLDQETRLTLGRGLRNMYKDCMGLELPKDLAHLLERLGLVTQ